HRHGARIPVDQPALMAPAAGDRGRPDGRILDRARQPQLDVAPGLAQDHLPARRPGHCGDEPDARRGAGRGAGLRDRPRGQADGMAVRALAALAALALAASPAAAQDELPDWTGGWEMVGGTLFDRASADPPDGRSGEPGVRQHPPYNEEWEAKYRANIALVAQ